MTAKSTASLAFLLLVGMAATTAQPQKAGEALGTVPLVEASNRKRLLCRELCSETYNVCDRKCPRCRA